jgi:DNA-binding beta-propeller fold protein YncE
MTVLLFTAPLQAQPDAAPKAVSQTEQISMLQKQSEEAYAAGKWVAFYIANMKLSEMHPYEPDYMVNIVRACALLGRKSTAYHYMLLMQQQGMTFDFDSTEDTSQIRDTEAYEYINMLLKNAATTSGVGALAFTAPGAPADFRAIAWDESREKFLLGTVSEGTVLAVSVDGDTEVLLKADDENGLWAISGLAVDSKNKRLWISSAAVPLFSGFSPADTNHGAVFELNLETLEIVGQYNFPVDGLKHEPGSVAVTDDGHVYVINRAAPIIYRKTPEGDRLEAFFASPDLLALRDIAVDPDNSRVFIADAYKGILTIDPVAEQAALLSGPETMNLGGIESIEYGNGMLFVVQGGFNPQRVIRLEFDASGTTAESVVPMAIALEAFNQPGIGTVQGESLYYIANRGADDAKSAIIMKTPLDAGVETTAPDVMEFKKLMDTKRQQKED